MNSGILTSMVGLFIRVITGWEEIGAQLVPQQVQVVALVPQPVRHRLVLVHQRQPVRVPAQQRVDNNYA